MSKDFKISTTFAPGIGLYLALDNSSRYKGLMIVLPLMTISIQVKRALTTDL